MKKHRYIHLQSGHQHGFGGPRFALAANPGSVSLQIPNFGPKACQNIISQGNNTNNGYYYNPATNQFTSFTFAAGIFQLGAHGIRYRSGTETRFLLIHGAAPLACSATTLQPPPTGGQRVDVWKSRGG